jgi:hypothetical protein
MARMRTPRTILQRPKIRHLPSRVTQPEGNTGTKCMEEDIGYSQVAEFSDLLAATQLRQDRPRAVVDHPLFQIFVYLCMCPQTFNFS